MPTFNTVEEDVTPTPSTVPEFVPPHPVSKSSEPGPPIDLSNGDGGVVKRIKRESTLCPSVTPQMGDQVTIHYVAMHGDDGVLFDSSRKLMNSGGFSFKLGSSEPMKEGMLRPKGMDIALTNMKVGECALLTLQPEYAFGKLGVRQPPRPGHTVPPNTFVVYNIDLIECGKATENMTPMEKMNKSEEYVGKGTTHFKAKEYLKAIAQYELALGVLQSYPNVRHDVGGAVNMEPKVVRARREIVRCLSNIATCHLMTSTTSTTKTASSTAKTSTKTLSSNWKETLKNCDQAIWVHDGGQVNDDRLLSKILYRRAEIYLQRSETVKARQDLERAYVCAPDSKSVSGGFGWVGVGW